MLIASNEKFRARKKHRPEACHCRRLKLTISNVALPPAHAMPVERDSL